MSNRSIWFIIGLMSLALMGVVLMQSYWINYSIHLNEAQFSKNVRVALHEVSQKLQLHEIETVSRSFYFPNIPSDPAERVFEEEIFFSLQQDPGIPVEYTYNGEIPEDSFLLIGKDIFYYRDRIDQPCLSTEEYIELQKQFDRVAVGIYNQGKPLLERINLSWFHSLLLEELKNKGVDLPPNYGLYSYDAKKFVFVNSCEKPPADQNEISEAGMHKLFSSPFKTDLFFNGLYSPGAIIVQFPGKTGFLWQSVIGMLAGSILFTGIILFCFFYTVKVIFTQKKLSEIKNDFINNMTHEFKTPIATISLAADSINNPMVSGDAGKVTRFAGIIKEENKRMNSQVEKVLQMALLDKKDFRLNLKEVDIHEVIRQAARTLALQVEQKEGTIELDLQAEDHYIEADPIHLSNVIHNLLDNANKYSPVEPRLRIRTENLANGVAVSVEDNGVGMNKEARKKIFDKFYRVSTGNLHDIKGFGLGLSYVKAIMTAHKGHIEVKSELGKGSEFTLFFPYQVRE